MAFTEFYCDASAGSNLNSGSDVGSPTTSTNGAYTRGAGAGGTDRFTAASGTPFSARVAGVDFVSIYADGASAPTGFVGLITAVNGGGASIDISLTAIAGTRPSDAASGVTAQVGGPWKGPNAASGFPFGVITSVLRVGSNYPRVNLKNNATYSVTSRVTQNATFLCVQGYSSTVGDGGKATIDGGTSGASYEIFRNDNFGVHYIDLIFANNGATGNSLGVSDNRSAHWLRCVFHDFRGQGLQLTNGGTGRAIVECEAYACNKSATGNTGVFYQDSGSASFIRCIAHDNSASGSIGFYNLGSATFVDCIADTNASVGFRLNTLGQSCVRCDAYGNGGDGFFIASTSVYAYLENCNAVKNGGYGINTNGSVVMFLNCGFGSGTQANTSGATPGTGSLVEIGTITYAANVTPWVDPANGDFRINLAAAKGTGRGSFTQTSGGSGTVGYPDVGAAQSQGGGASPIGLGSPVIRAMV